MPTIAEQLAQLAQIKSDIKDAIEAKGETVGSDALSTYATHISNISGGGGEADNLDELFLGNLTEYTFPSGCTTAPGFVFRNNTKIVKITLNAGLVTIGENLCYGCSNLATMNDFPSSVRTIGSGAFYNTKIAGAFTIPNGVTTLASQVFDGCRFITSFDFPSTLTSIGTYNFRNNLAVTTIICRATTPPTVQSTTFGNSNSNYMGRTTYNTGVNKLYVPQGCSSAYNTSYWASVLLDSTKCGFTIAELDANGNIPT